MHPVVVLLRYIHYNLIISRIITGRWGPVVGTLLLPPPNVNSMSANLRVVPPTVETGTLVLSQCPEFYAKDTLILLQAIYLRIFWFVLQKPQAGIKPAPSHQAELAGRRDIPTPGFLLFEANPGAGIIPALVAAEGLVLGPKSYAQALVGLAGPGQAIFSCPVNPDQAHPPLSNLGSPIGDPFSNQVPWAQESLSSQSKNDDQIGKPPITPEANPFRTNGQPSQDGPPKSQTTVPENPKNNHEAAHQTAEPDMPSLAIQIASEECPEAPACE
ncbi:hypothetical protein DSO57_1003137 [Entomophthora muscae]|uniref:Uncharacterized protein n=1 Tax=Entomophthora muscae TaxID=34485 RepID=A0ACC2RNA3_9FUNG|nr:hypothetical protein DSO57_1003137 [Entomophthora muscae]